MLRKLLVPCLLALGVAAPSLAANRQFKHVIIVVQENRSTDNLFGSNPKFEPGVDVAKYGLASTGAKVALGTVPLTGCYDLHHDHAAFVLMYDGGKMDGANKVPTRTQGPCTIPPTPQFKYVDNSTGQIQQYFDIATQYGFANRMFQSNQGPSYPAHQFIFGGTSAPDATSWLFTAENMTYKRSPTGIVAGCSAPSTQRVVVIDQNGNETTNPPVFPCYERPTLSDELVTAGIPWKYYTPGEGSIWTAPDSIQHICAPAVNPTTGVLACAGQEWLASVVLQPSSILTDIASCNLAGVSWVMPEGINSDHAIANTGGGPAWVASIVNAVGSQPSCGGESYWNDTAILITWDDWGGWYDHVPPPRIGQSNGWGTGYVYGFRVPLLVVSAYTPAGYVDNVVHDFGSLLRMVESNFSLSVIGQGTYADAYADDLSSFFTLSTPRPFTPIALPAGARDMRIAPDHHTPPDDDGDDD